ncbi:MAG TPA: hypothetical protein VK656_03605 [Candidatus Acidoferrum sp.]|nr:hypothetical protein [Candidatus Acidoferrum sp.]
MSHPSLGLPPLDETAGFPVAASRLRAATAEVGRRALEATTAGDPTLAERIGETGLRQLLRDTEVWVDRIALSVAAGDPEPMRAFAEQIAPPYRRRRVSMEDATKLAEGFRAALRSVLTPAEQPTADAALDAAIAVFVWHRRIAGDARKRNRILQAIYKGA